MTYHLIVIFVNRHNHDLHDKHNTRSRYFLIYGGRFDINVLKVDVILIRLDGDSYSLCCCCFTFWVSQLTTTT